MVKLIEKRKYHLVLTQTEVNQLYVVLMDSNCYKHALINSIILQLENCIEEDAEDLPF